jgi:hypothetical protein
MMLLGIFKHMCLNADVSPFHASYNLRHLYHANPQILINLTKFSYSENH